MVCILIRSPVLDTSTGSGVLIASNTYRLLLSPVLTTHACKTGDKSRQYVTDTIIENIPYYGYKTDKRHLNQASFVPPIKFVNNLYLREITLCFKMPYNNKNVNKMSTHYNKHNES